MPFTTEAACRCTTTRSITSALTATGLPQTGKSGTRGCYICLTCANRTREIAFTYSEDCMKRFLLILALFTGVPLFAQQLFAQQADATEIPFRSVPDFLKL